MIARLNGTLIDREGGAVIIDCNGVGYEVWISASTANGLPARGEQVLLRIFTHATAEQGITLYGFATAEERSLFDLLITVKRVGPTSAIKILSAGASPQEIAQMIASEQASALKSIKGVGKKTADMMVVELREKCEELLVSWGAAGAPVAPVPRLGSEPRPSFRADLDPLQADVLSALVQLGWRPAEAEKALAAIELGADITLESALRRALAAMPRP